MKNNANPLQTLSSQTSNVSANGRGPNNVSRNLSSVATQYSASFSYSAKPRIISRITGTSFTDPFSMRIFRLLRYTHGQMKLYPVFMLPFLAMTGSAATVAEARAFIDKAEQELMQINIMGNRTGWVQETYITDDTESINAAQNDRIIARTTELVKQSKQFDSLNLPVD